MLSVGADHDAPSAAISADGVVKRYGETTAVDHASLSIPVGLVFGIVGPNSAGKTTLIECIEGIRTPDEGRIAVLGLDNIRDAQQIKQRIGVQLQKTGFFPDLTLRETLDLYASLYRRAHDVPDLLRRLAIDDKARTLVKDTSGGIFQRLSLAVALVNDPDLIFLDEPTTGLDPQARVNLWGHIRALRDERGSTVFLTTHYLEEADALCDRILIIDNGTIVAAGTPEELKRQVSGDAIILTATNPADAPGIAAAAAALGSDTPPHVDGSNISVRVPHGGTALPGLLRALDAKGLALAAVELRRPSLDDVFLTVTGRSLRDGEQKGAAA